jgi:hypothetical protein
MRLWIQKLVLYSAGMGIVWAVDHGSAVEIVSSGMIYILVITLGEGFQLLSAEAEEKLKTQAAEKAAQGTEAPVSSGEPAIESPLPEPEGETSDRNGDPVNPEEDHA